MAVNDVYLAFSDLSGFKSMMGNRSVAYEALDFMYNKAYELLEDNTEVKALAVSDCVISWTAPDRFSQLLEFVTKLNKKLIRQRYLLKTTIAYGKFEYENRINLQNLRKEFIMGGAYLTAFLENEKRKYAGSILLIGKKPPTTSEEWRWKIRSGKNWDYFWSARDHDHLKKIKKDRYRYKSDYEKLKDLYRE